MNVQTKVTADTLFERDYFAWVQQQVALLQDGDVGALDRHNLAEEVESLGLSQLSEMQSRMTVIIEHLLKVQYGARREPVAGWKRTIVTQRGDLDDLFENNRSLRNRAGDRLDRRYRNARKRALLGFEEYEPENLVRYRRVLPLGCPYTVEQILDEDWLPDPQV